MEAAPELCAIDISPDHTLHVYAGLCHLKGNPLPHFTLVADYRKSGRLETGGSCHDLILHHAPQFKTLAALHLSDMNGVPMHAEANGWYWLTSCLPHTKPPYLGARYVEKDEHKALKFLAEHLRIDLAAARSLVCKAELDASMYSPDTARANFREYIERQKPRWKTEADEAIQAFNLRVFGNACEPEADEADYKPDCITQYYQDRNKE